MTRTANERTLLRNLVGGALLLVACGAADEESASTEPSIAPTQTVPTTALPTVDPVPSAAAPAVDPLPTAVAPAAGPFTLTSPAFAHVPECSGTSVAACAIIPAEHTSYMQGQNLSPELHWTDAPAGTQSFALTLVDVSYGQPLWAIWNIPGTASLLPPNLAKDAASLQTPPGAQQSNATFAEGEGYWGPDTPCNVYEFELFALSTPTFTPSNAEYVALVRSDLQGSTDILGRVTLSGRNNYMLACQ